MKKIPLKGGYEYDILTSARKYYKFKPKVAKQIKRQYNKRFRKHGKSELSNEKI